MWKLTDFGLSSTGTSKNSAPTEHRRGTSRYRAPELLKFSTVTNKVDIWGLGCILHELITSEVAFDDDYKVQEFDDDPDSFLQLLGLSGTKFFQHYISENIRDLLHKNHMHRPRALTLDRMYASFLHISRVPGVLMATSFPSYFHGGSWWTIILWTIASYFTWRHCTR
jgi:serine/threonine protein kinase